jgi:hypothetical protein
MNKTIVFPNPIQIGGGGGNLQIIIFRKEIIYELNKLWIILEEVY